MHGVEHNQLGFNVPKYQTIGRTALPYRAVGTKLNGAEVLTTANHARLQQALKYRKLGSRLVGQYGDPCASMQKDLTFKCSCHLMKMNGPRGLDRASLSRRRRPTAIAVRTLCLRCRPCPINREWTHLGNLEILLHAVKIWWKVQVVSTYQSSKRASNPPVRLATQLLRLPKCCSKKLLLDQAEAGTRK